MALRITFLLSCLTFVFLSCQSEIFNSSQSFDQVDEELWTYFESFQEEAAVRGIELNLNDLDLSGEVAGIAQDGVAGSCQYGSSITNHVTIDQEFWQDATPNQREYVVYHELGHCVLLRDHDESTNNSGHCLSVMASGTGTCLAIYNQSNRETYLDELFLEND